MPEEKPDLRLAALRRFATAITVFNLLGNTATLLCFPWVGIAQPYMFTENLTGAGKWILPGLLVLSGSFLNFRFTRKVPLILGWLTAFALQATVRCLVFGTPLVPKLLP